MSTGPTIMIIAGEDSADQYGAKLVEALSGQHPGAKFFGIGGNKMHKAGVELLFTTADTSIMGFAEVVKNYGFIRRMFKTCERELISRQPSLVILMDYPGFNLRFAKTVKANGIPVLYYIAPQVWAWGKNRAAKMKGLIDRLAVAFPFEEKIFEDAGIPTTFVGHPLLDVLKQTDRTAFLEEFGLPEKDIIALFPGSRKQEVERMLMPMAEAADRVAATHNCTVAIGASHVPEQFFESVRARYPEMKILRNATHRLMEHATAAVVKSGTSTVETAYYKTPMVVCYLASRLNYMIGKRLINVENIGMVNILAGSQIVPELVQDDFTVDNIARELGSYFEDEAYYEATVVKLARIREKMGTPGTAERVAELASPFLTSA